MNLLTVIFRKISVLGVWALLFSVFLSGETVFGQTKESLQYGDLLYSQKQYVLAARQYSTYLQSNAKASGAESVWYKLGECYLKNKQYADSQTTFKYIVDTYKKGPIVGAAAYSLAVLNYNKKNAGDAERYFGIAARESKDPMEQVKAKYYLAKTLQLAQKFDPALKLYQEVIDTKIDGKDNPLKDRSQLELARAKFDKGDIKGALDLFESLSRTAVSEDVKQEALARAGLLAAQAGEVDRSEKLLEQVLKSSETNPWREYAQVGIIYNAFARQDYDKVVGIYSLGNYKVDEKSRAKVLLIIGHSYRMKGELPHAERLYKLIEAKFPDTPEGSEAGFRVLQVLHQQNKGSLPVAVRAFTD
ncbi:MAG: tetratricopeptide repeat protein [Verrucomicrobiota bacterium]